MHTIFYVVKLIPSTLSPIMSLAGNISLCCLILQLLSINSVVCVEMKEFHPEERDALLLLRDSVSSDADLHSNWTGPPCIVNRSRWKGITCSNWHVISIDLEGINVVGSLPPMFLQNITFLKQLNLRSNSISGMLPNLTNLVILEQVLLSYNHFTGHIPAEYVELPSLRSLELEENYLEGQIPDFDQPLLTAFNVSYNHLSGPIPETNVLLRFPKSSFDDNSDLCGKPLDKLCPAPPPAPSSAPSPQIIAPSPGEETKKKKLQVWTIALIAAAGGLLLLLLCIAFMFCKKRKRGEEKTRNESAAYTFGVWAQKMSFPERAEDSERLGQLQFFNKELPVFDLDDLLRASAEVLGKGNLGATYKATLETGTVVAVKKLDSMNELSKREFLQQMQLLGKIKHENLVEIISFYYSENEKLVIYEFISDGTLFELLHENRGAGRVPLDWATRMSIIKDIAKGLAFLHNSLSSHKGLHANLKSPNVLIHQHSQGCHSKLTDFGFLPLLSSRKCAEMLAISRSPEFAQGKRITQQADVYCFGIILLEIITGKVPGETLGEDMEEATSDLSEWVRMVVYNDWSTDILDMEILAAKEAHDAMLQLTELALECTDMTPENRPKINQVLRKIEEIEQMKGEND
ncbi:hypothetical protein L6164_006254 [Bauhinia variegata]|uniref:Uncharacterized protein n=2 Tax=Bauhinia variegata TaxID=167791 RepID=A0ACB9PT76_BAUVA|nr:hypothetical protein L6164_006254 [Bauhinia variegata]